MAPDISFPSTDRLDLEVPAPELLVLSLSALLWLVLLQGWLPGLGPPPAGLEAPMDAPGAPEAIAAANGLGGVAAYLLLWGTMMLAMMLPSLLPVVRTVREEVCASRSVFGSAIVAFLGAYGLAWTLVGAVPLAVAVLVPIRELLTASAFGVSVAAIVVSGLLAFAGVYQQTALKRDLLARCGRCHSVPHRPESARMARDGLSYAANCIGCTWPLFALMVALGSMNVLVMVGLTLVVSIERLAPDEAAAARALGIVLLGAAVFTLLFGVPAV
ncbi:DUF2182 domain-containing protein [Haloterrigena salifodinae]|uniref:DUF2182 domain-containing protein n=1 Tax=Haloterrigena salifodinae TaxID=2675099 RepID=A0A8T8E2V6_9EURY|nr:DUF2182 domain-containing protein [Haloterrigena salifodinae]QRV15721.1 DUF2182 domain-containing protein [Haloterrigena salifodinae]